MDSRHPTNIFIYSSSSIVASSFALLFQQDDRFLALSGNSEEVLLNGVKNRNFELIVIFESAVDTSTFDLIRKITSCPSYDESVKIVVLGDLAHDVDLLTLIKLGVSGYFISSMNTDDMIFYLNNISKGIPYYSMRVLAPLMRRLVLENDELLSMSFTESELLTKREMAILKDICKGCSVEEIGSHLYISKSTVKNHLSSIYRKMGVSNRTQALLVAIREGLYVPE